MAAAFSAGGAGGIRTPEGLAPQHAFQACALNHSATAPFKECVGTIINTHPDASRNSIWAGSVLAHLQCGHEGVIGNLDLAEGAHALFAGLLFFQQLALAGHVAAVTFGGDVLA